MNKDFGLKNELDINSDQLRKRITGAIKQLRDETEELDLPQGKVMPMIPVTGSKNLEDKYFKNKSPKTY